MKIGYTPVHFRQEGDLFEWGRIEEECKGDWAQDSRRILS